MVTLLVTVALPPLVPLFTSLGAELPWTTRLLITVADLAINYKFHLLGGLLIVIAAVFGLAWLAVKFVLTLIFFLGQDSEMRLCLG